MSSTKRKLNDVDWNDIPNTPKKQYILLDTSNPTPSAHSILDQQPLTPKQLSPTVELLINNNSSLKPIVHRGIKRKGNFEIDTVDVNIPFKKNNSTIYFNEPTIIRSNNRKKIPLYRLHPSMLHTDKILKKKPRKRSKRKKRKSHSKKTNSYIRYHPTIQGQAQNFVRYHPSINLT